MKSKRYLYPLTILCILLIIVITLLSEHDVNSVSDFGKSVRSGPRITSIRSGLDFLWKSDNDTAEESKRAAGGASGPKHLASPPVTILHWNTAYNRYPYMTDDFEKCPVSNCQVTTIRNLSHLADAITFHGSYMGVNFKSEQFQVLRANSKATFIFYDRDPPTYTHKSGEWSKDFFDATMTYRRDSDIFNAIYEVVPKV